MIVRKQKYRYYSLENLIRLVFMTFIFNFATSQKFSYFSSMLVNDFVFELNISEITSVFWKTCKQ